MTTLPDWLVERAALDEVPAASRDRVAQADAGELAARVEALRADNAAELAKYPAAAAVAQIDARVATSRRLRAQRRYWTAGVLGAVAAIALVLVVMRPAHTGQVTREDDPEITRVKGKTRLLAFRLAGDQIEALDPDAIVSAGDLIQLRYKAGTARYGVIASVDGAGAVTLHYPASEDAAPEATALDGKTTALPNAYQLDDAPRFERFFFITSDAPIEIASSLDALRTFAQRDDSATATPELPSGLRQWSLRLRKPEASQ